MISCEILEQPGAWRGVVLAAIILTCFGPTLPLFVAAYSDGVSTFDDIFASGFGTALLHSLTVAAAVTLVSLAIGTPAGLLAAFYEFPGRRVLLALVGIPLVIPSFLWAIGLSQLRIHLAMPSGGVLSGWSGTVLSFSAPGIALVLYMTMISARHLSKSQVDGARLIGGEILLLSCATKAIFPAAVVTAVLAGVLTLSDPGPGQILEYSGVPYEILVSFSAFYDYGLAAKQSILLAAVVLLVTIPLAVFIAPGVAIGLLGRDTGGPQLARNRPASTIAAAWLAAIVVLTTALPLSGILVPLFRDFPLQRALTEIARTAGDTFLYAAVAGLIAAALGVVLGVAIGRGRRLRTIALAALFVVLSLPPSLSALGFVKLGATAPEWLDPLLRSRFTVGLALALRFLPIAAVLAMRAYGSMSPSQCHAAAVHGLSLPLFVSRILGPQILPAAAIGGLVVALAATADIGTVVLLRPPGADSLPVQIFTIMANAPESLVAALCLFYVAGVAVLLIAGWHAAGRSRAA